MIEVRAQPIATEAFAPFGEVLEGPGGKDRLDYAATLANTRAGARANLALVRARPIPLPLRVSLLERHPSSSQAFVPLAVARYLVLACPAAPGGEPDVARIAAFIAGGRVGINYRRGVWHHAMAALDEDGVFAMLVWEDGSAGDCAFAPIEEAVVVVAG